MHSKSQLSSLATEHNLFLGEPVLTPFPPLPHRIKLSSWRTVTPAAPRALRSWSNWRFQTNSDSTNGGIAWHQSIWKCIQTLSFDPSQTLPKLWSDILQDPAILELRLRGWSVKDIRVTVSAIPSFPTIWNRQSFENDMKYDEAVVDGTNPAPPGM